MSKNLIASKLIESVRDKAMIADDDSVYNDERILNILNEEMDIGLIDTLMTLHEEHLVVPTVISPYKVDNTGYRYIIPSRAIGSKLRDLFFVNGDNFWELSRIDLDEIGDFNSYNNFQSLGANLFYMQGDEIVVVNGTMSGTTELTAYFYIRPNEIVLESTCAQISSIDRTTGIIQFDILPKSFNTLTIVDFIQNKNPNKILGTDIAILNTNLNNRTITMNPSLIPDRLMVGDWIADVGMSPYPNVPMELQPVLAQRAVVAILEALGDSANLGNALGKLRRIEKSVQKTLDNRVEGAPKKIKTRYSTLNSTSMGRNSRRGR